MGNGDHSVPSQGTVVQYSGCRTRIGGVISKLKIKFMINHNENW